MVTLVTRSHIAEILDTPEIVKSVESGDTGETQGGPQAAQLRPGARGRGEEGEEGEAPWVRGHSQQVQGLHFRFQGFEMKTYVNYKFGFNHEI